MADIENQPEVTLPAKRKPDICCQGQENLPTKTQKLQAFGKNSTAPEEKCGLNEEEENGNKIHIVDSSTEEKIVNNSGNSEEKIDQPKEEAEEDEEADYEEEEEDAGDDEDDDSGDQSSEEAEVDRKGKGILRDDKGKGKLIEEEDSDDSSDGGNESEADSDLSDDPLAEVDLDNILPSRTRRRVVQPGFYIANDPGNNGDDDSDDSDAWNEEGMTLDCTLVGKETERKDSAVLS